MIYCLIGIFLSLYSSSLFSQIPMEKEKIFIAEPESKIAGKDNFKDRLKSVLVIKALKLNPARFIVLDNDYMKSILEIKVRQQQLGCSESECELKLEKILNPNWKLSTVISGNEKTPTISLKLFKISGDTSSIYSVSEKNFEVHQLEFFIEEMLISLFNPNYKIRDEIAPIKIDILNDLSFLKLKDTSMSIPEFQINRNSDKSQNFINDTKQLLMDANENYDKEKYWESFWIYAGILNTMIHDLTGETRENLKDYEKFLMEKVDISYYNSYSTSIKKIDQKVLENPNMILNDILNYYMKYEGIYQHFLNYKKQYPGYPREVENLLSNRLDTLLISKWKLDEKLGDTRFSSYNFSNSYEIYDKILQDMKKVGRKESELRKKYRESLELKKLYSLRTGTSFLVNKVLALTEIMERKNAVYMSYKRAGRESSIDAIEADKTLKKIAPELEVLFRDPEQSLFINNYIIRINDKVAKEINESRSNVSDPFRVSEYGNLDFLKRLAQDERRKKEIKELEKKTSQNSISTTTQSQNSKKENSKQTQYNNKNWSYYVKNTLLFPFKYSLNILKSITDIVSITPIAGLGFGGEILVLSAGGGFALAPEDFSITSVVPFEKDSIPGAPGELVFEAGFLGHNTCDNFFFLRGVSGSGCTAGYPEQLTTTNIWFALGAGAHFAIDFGRVLDILPVLLFLDAPSIIYDDKFRAERIHYFPDR